MFDSILGGVGLRQVIVSRLVHPENTVCSNVVTYEGIVISIKLLQSLNKPLPSIVILLGIFIFTSPVHPENVA